MPTCFVFVRIRPTNPLSLQFNKITNLMMLQQQPWLSFTCFCLKIQCVWLVGGYVGVNGGGGLCLWCVGLIFLPEKHSTTHQLSHHIPTYLQNNSNNKSIIFSAGGVCRFGFSHHFNVRASTFVHFNLLPTSLSSFILSLYVVASLVKKSNNIHPNAMKSCIFCLIRFFLFEISFFSKSLFLCMVDTYNGYDDKEI